ncbi:hypothetical protein [Neisseria sicca]|jgi:hypothetical protein|uniref:hypothetical protein n=1 Tax=Neisseria sicca TaxID=490 RepID=UPI0011BD1804|nr:hypothetical protein [Neisseria sicca]
MAYLVRKISRAKWKNFDDPEGVVALVLDKLSADAITSCLRTSKNSLSFWLLSDIDDSKELNKILFALTVKDKNTDDISATDIIFLKEEELLKQEIKLKKIPGITVDDNLKSLHIDLCDLNHTNLTFLAGFFCEILNQEKSKRFTQAQMKSIIKEHIMENPKLKEEISNKLKTKLNLEQA